MAKKSKPTLYTAYRRPVFLLGCLLFLAANLAKFPLLDPDNAWRHGFAHPLAGWDHIVTLLAVGIWAAQLRGHAVWLLPLAFVGVMSIGGIAGTAGILIPAAEGIILLSCAVFTFLIIHRIKFSSRTNLVIVAFFAFFHGFAHGQEISASASLLSYSVGFMLATLLLHGAGILVAKLVLFCATCFFALLLPTLTHAAHSQTSSKNLTASAAVMGIGRSLVFYSSGDGLYDGPDRIVHDDLVLYKQSPGNIIPDKPSLGIYKLKRQTFHADPPVTCKVAKWKTANGNFFTLNQAIINPPAEGPGQFLPIKQDNSPSCAACFKHFYPDINYTPGQALLSNGVGLTSPPLLSAFIASSSNSSCRHVDITQVPSIDGCLLQQTKPQLAVAIAVSNSAIVPTNLKSHQAFPVLFEPQKINLKTVSAFYPPNFYRFDRLADKVYPDFRPDNAAYLILDKKRPFDWRFFAVLFHNMRGKLC